eukprot:scaffold1168_cov167-Amphora_coffeaeformis.AAC.17
MYCFVIYKWLGIIVSYQTQKFQQSIAGCIKVLRSVGFMIQNQNFELHVVCQMKCLGVPLDPTKEVGAARDVLG